jgi:hypothetical protein
LLLQFFLYLLVYLHLDVVLLSTFPEEGKLCLLFSRKSFLLQTNIKIKKESLWK